MKRFVLAAVAVLAVIGTVMSAVNADPAPIARTTFGAWHDGTAKGVAVFAASTDEGGAVLGQFCYLRSKVCMYLITMPGLCTAGDEYSALLSTDIGTGGTDLVCSPGKADGQAVFEFEDFGKIDRFVRGAGSIGIAIPLTGGTFNSARFSLRGSSAAISAMHKVFAGRIAQRPAPRQKISPAMLAEPQAVI